MKARLATAITAALVVLAAPPNAGAQDFGCTGALNNAERAICASASLRDLDERLARLYGWVWDATPGWRRAALRKDQRAFLQLRNDCEGRERCLSRIYGARISELAVKLAAGPRRYRHE